MSAQIGRKQGKKSHPNLLIYARSLAPALLQQHLIPLVRYTRHRPALGCLSDQGSFFPLTLYSSCDEALAHLTHNANNDYL